jgi:hypothetical protein
MGRNYDDASFQAVCPSAAPTIVPVAAVSTGWTPIPPAVPVGVDRYRLQIEAVGVDYQLRFSGEATGITVPADTTYAYPDALDRAVTAEIKLSAGSATVRAFVGYPSL